MIIWALTTLIFHSILSKAWQGFWGSKCGCFHKRAQLLGYQFCLCIALRAGTAQGQIEGYLRVILAGIVEKFVLCVQPWVCPCPSCPARTEQCCDAGAVPRRRRKLCGEWIHQHCPVPGNGPPYTLPSLSHIAVSVCFFFLNAACSCLRRQGLAGLELFLCWRHWRGWMFSSEVLVTSLIVKYGDLCSVSFYIPTGIDWGCFRLRLYMKILICVINSPSWCSCWDNCRREGRAEMRENRLESCLCAASVPAVAPSNVHLNDCVRG